MFVIENVVFKVTINFTINYINVVNRHLNQMTCYKLTKQRTCVN